MIVHNQSRDIKLKRSIFQSEITENKMLFFNFTLYFFLKLDEPVPFPYNLRSHFLLYLIKDKRKKYSE